MITLCWASAATRSGSTSIAARLDIGVRQDGGERAGVVELGRARPGGRARALWFPQPHLLRFWMTSADGSRFTRSERTAGPTLLWIHDGTRVTLRLEGVASKTRAREIAKSLGAAGFARAPSTSSE